MEFMGKISDGELLEIATKFEVLFKWSDDHLERLEADGWVCEPDHPLESTDTLRELLDRLVETARRK
jgi:hypothetical protein